MTVTTALTGTLAAALRWLFKYLAWLFLAAATTLGGALVLMLVKDWTLKAVVTSLLAWPALAAAMLVGMLMALLPLGRVYFWSAVGGGLLYNALLAFA
jgi:hypothetical protein